MSKRNTEILVGFFVLLGMAGLAFLALKAANLGTVGGGDTYTIKANFDNIGGLKVRAPVRTAGVTVGRVTDIDLDGKTYQGVVTMEIARAYQYPRDSSAKILTSGLLGDQYVGMDPGGDDRTLAGGDTVPQTQSAVVLESLIGQFLSNTAEGPGAAPATAPAAPPPAAPGMAAPAATSPAPASAGSGVAP